MKFISLKSAKKGEETSLDHCIQWQKMHLISRGCAVIASISYSYLLVDLTVVDDVVVFFTIVLPPEMYPPPEEQTPPPPMLHMPLPLLELKLLRPPDPP